MVMNPHHFPPTVEDSYRAIEGLDLITRISFHQPGYKIYVKAVILLLNAAATKPYQDELQHVPKLYGDDFDSSGINILIGTCALNVAA